MYQALSQLSSSVASHTASFGNAIQQPLNLRLRRRLWQQCIYQQYNLLSTLKFYSGSMTTNMHYSASKTIFQYAEVLRKNMTEAEKILWERLCKNSRHQRACANKKTASDK